ncbi:MAG: hypothetical protein JWR26_4610 [Pedosphaera sp.]|nr:hypothetical protein [Pedosphaera sp.]
MGKVSLHCSPPFLLRFQKATADRLLRSPACGTWRFAEETECQQSGGPGWQATRHDPPRPGVFYFFVFANGSRCAKPRAARDTGIIMGTGRPLCESGVWFFLGVGRGRVAADETSAVRCKGVLADCHRGDGSRCAKPRAARDTGTMGTGRRKFNHREHREHRETGMKTRPLLLSEGVGLSWELGEVLAHGHRRRPCALGGFCGPRWHLNIFTGVGPREQSCLRTATIIIMAWVRGRACRGWTGGHKEGKIFPGGRPHGLLPTPGKNESGISCARVLLSTVRSGPPADRKSN